MAECVALGKLGQAELEVRDMGWSGWLLIARADHYHRELRVPLTLRSGRSGLVAGIEQIRAELEECNGQDS